MVVTTLSRPPQACKFQVLCWSPEPQDHLVWPPLGQWALLRTLWSPRCERDALTSAVVGGTEGGREGERRDRGKEGGRESGREREGEGGEGGREERSERGKEGGRGGGRKRRGG